MLWAGGVVLGLGVTLSSAGRQEDGGKKRKQVDRWHLDSSCNPQTFPPLSPSLGHSRLFQDEATSEMKTLKMQRQTDKLLLGYGPFTWSQMDCSLIPFPHLPYDQLATIKTRLILA